MIGGTRGNEKDHEQRPNIAHAIDAFLTLRRHFKAIYYAPHDDGDDEFEGRTLDTIAKAATSIYNAVTG